MNFLWPCPCCITADILTFLRTMLPFSVVEFVECGTVAIVPRNWFSGPDEQQCFWPPSSTVNIDRAVKEGSSPQEDWPVFQVRVLGKAADYSAARIKLRKAEVTSDLQTDPEPERTKRKRRPRIIDSDSETEESTERAAPLPPKRLLSKALQPPAGILLGNRAQTRTTPERPLNTGDAPNTNTHVTGNPHRPTTHSGMAPLLRDEMFLRILTILEEIKATQAVHGSMIQALLMQRDCSNTVPLLPEGATFPLTSFKDVEDIELKLSDPAFQKNVVSVLGDIGGRSIDECTRRMMAFLMTNGLALGYNLMGRHGKREFRSLHLFNVLHGGLKQNAFLRNITKKDVERAVSKWFSNARDRDGNRALRAQRDLQKRNAEQINTQ
ncbi:uncharacterized protein LOC143525422 isoform X2 [Brachyhypopomus gauderio]|uniref:uncharacterized protein LOC143525422 isoform X2 n=1 Tax=Brachyhypopomus gauderio TaxID=698409 RepID=UPI004040FF8F